jgi:transposase
MRGRKPHPVSIADEDVRILEHIARRRKIPWFQVRRAHILLGIAEGQRIQDLAKQLHCGTATIWRICRCYDEYGLEGVLAEASRLDRPTTISPLQRAEIVELACLEPIARGLHITHWTSGDLARQVVADGIVPAISPATVRRILQHVDLQPHRTRYWKTSHLDAQFKERAEKVLWCYANAERLAAQGIWVVCTDEMPNLQVLERRPIRRAIPGYIEHQEFEYIRHGTVNVLVFLVVHTGRMEAVCLESKSAQNYIQQLRHFRRRHRHLLGVFLIQDGDPTHTAAATEEYFAQCEGWWRPRPTPVHASWLDQAELLNDAFSYHYLKRASWDTRLQFIEHIDASWPEYNRLYAHPFEWTWTNHQMRKWFAEHAE